MIDLNDVISIDLRSKCWYRQWKWKNCFKDEFSFS